MTDHPDCKVKFHNWWNAPRTWAKVQEIDPEGSHASWMENFPWTRLSDVVLPDSRKPTVDAVYMKTLNPQKTRAYVGDGNMGGIYQHADADMQALWDIAIEETQTLLTEGWD